MDTRWLSFSVGDVDFEVSSDKFSFCATEYDINENWKVTHKKDMPVSGKTFLHLDYRISGVDSRSCGGEDIQTQCRITLVEEFDFTITIKSAKR